MSIESMAIVLHHSTAKGTALTVLLGIANHEGDGGAWPSVETLAKYGRCSERRVQQVVKELVTAGELAVEYKAGGLRETADHVRPNMYRVLVACPKGCDGTSQHRTKRQRRVGRTADEAGFIGGGETGFTREAKPTAPEPSFNHPSEPSVNELNCPSDLRFAPVGAGADEIPQRAPEAPRRRSRFVDWKPEDVELFVDLVGERLASDGSVWKQGTFPATAFYEAFRKTKGTDEDGNDKEPMEWPGRYFAKLDERGQVEEWLASQGLEAA